MDPPMATDEGEADGDKGPDPLAVAHRLVDFAAMALSLWYVWHLLSREPEFEAAKRRAVAWARRHIDRVRARERLRRTDPVRAAEWILETEGAGDGGT